MKEKVYFYYNEEKKLAKELYDKSIEFFKKQGLIILEKDREKEADFYVVIGGDGTLLRAFKKFTRLDIPIIAVNAGHLGFLAEIKKEHMLEEYQNFLQDNCRYQERHFLKITIGEQQYRALNEVVITRDNRKQNIIQMEVFMKDTFVNHYKGDGLIIATPTGSTAYSLSAGGPILGVPLQLYLLTPLAPHNLNTRAIILDGTQKMEVSLIKEHRAYCVIDGNNEKELSGKEKIEISYAEETLRLVVPRNRDYYSIIREKLKWGENLC